MVYTSDKVRNICLLGHRGNGKTTLAESLLFWNGKTDRLGSVTQGNTVCDYDPEEIKRKMSVSLTSVFLEHRDTKINLIDGPGFYDFVGENISAVAAADAALIVASAKQSVSVGAEKAVSLTEKAKMPKAFFISQLDVENTDYFTTLDQLYAKFGDQHICPVWLPIMEGGKWTGYVDTLHSIAFLFKGNDVTAADIPAALVDRAAECHDKLIELIAETDDELMNKYFEGESIEGEELEKGFRDAMLQCLVFPVLCGVPGIGSRQIADFMVDYFPAAVSTAAIKAQDKGADIELTYSVDGPAALQIFKTITDPFVGKLSMFKVLSGKIVKDETYLNSRTGAKEKVAHVYIPQGKQQVEVDAVNAGDIGVLTKLMSAQTGDVLCDKNREITVSPIEFPKSYFGRAIAPVTKGEEERMASGLAKLMEQDPTLRLENNVETGQTVIYGAGDIQLDILVNRLAGKPYAVKVALDDVRVAYRETIRKKVKVQGKHKKQSGGHGQFGDVWIEFEPCDEPFVFAETVFGGAVPKNYFPAVEKGLRESIKTGVLAGYPVTGLKATLTDGSYHPVDSSEMAFKIAASLAFKEGMKQASPTLLEPIGRLIVNVSDALMGDIIGDINKRRGQVLSMDAAPEHGRRIVQADVPASEMGDYAMNLRSMTHGRASFDFDFLEYRPAPETVIEKVVSGK